MRIFDFVYSDFSESCGYMLYLLRGWGIVCFINDSTKMVHLGLLACTLIMPLENKICFNIFKGRITAGKCKAGGNALYLGQDTSL